MHSDDDYGSGQVPLAGPNAPAWAEEHQARAARRSGFRRARRVSNWTAAALIAGTGAATVAFAHQAFPAAAPAPAGTGTGAATGAGTAAGAPAASGPQVTHSVATTSGSGVTTTTTTRTVNGRTVITRTVHAPAYTDN